MDRLWVLECPCSRCLFDDPQKVSIWRCNPNTCPELTEWLITISNRNEDCEKMAEDRKCLQCGEAKPLLPNGLCKECAAEIARSPKQS